MKWFSGAGSLLKAFRSDRPQLKGTYEKVLITDITGRDIRAELRSARHQATRFVVIDDAGICVEMCGSRLPRELLQFRR